MENYMLGAGLAFAGAVLLKITDDLIDEKIMADTRLKYLLAIAYGTLLGFLLSLSTEAATWGLAIVVGVLLHGRIDGAHQWAVAAVIAMLAFFGVPAIDFRIFALLAFFALLDEVLNERHDSLARKGAGMGRLKKFVLEERVTMPAACLAVSAITNNYLYLVLMLAFEAGYILAEKGSALLPHYSTSFARQFIFDCYHCSQAKLGSEEFVKETINGIVKILGMRKISETLALCHEAEKPEDSGVTGFVIIAESHIAIHTYPKKSLAKVDVVSCRGFDAAKVEAYLRERFRPGRIKMAIVPRSLP